MNTQTFYVRTLITVLALLLSGFKAPTHHHTMGNSGKKVPEAPVSVSAPATPPLDLSIPFKTPDNSNATSAIIDDDEPTLFNGLFAPPPKIGEAPLQLKGGWINSPEPEIEKRKSVDGASIMINIKE
ncbi:MAG: hypothetical protein PHU14_05840 [Methylovulum sp.]|nr:hypothetical protein [Methylovulum sp.]